MYSVYDNRSDNAEEKIFKNSQKTQAQDIVCSIKSHGLTG